VFSEHLTV